MANIIALAALNSISANNKCRFKNLTGIAIRIAVVISCLFWTAIDTNELNDSIDRHQNGTVSLEYDVRKIGTIEPYCNKSLPICHDPTCSRKVASCFYKKIADIAALLSSFKNISEYIISIIFTIDNGSCDDFPPTVFETFAVIPKLGLHCKPDVSCNNITTFMPQKLIWTLDIFSCNGNMSDSFLTQFTSISTLLLSWNEIKYLNTKAFLNLPQITQLDLTQNEIEEVPLFRIQNTTVLSNLQSLSLNNNQLTLLPAYCFLGLHELVDLFLCDNYIAAIDSKTFEGLRNLRCLDLRGNNIANWPDFAFSPLISLTVLNLSFTGMYSVSKTNNLTRLTYPHHDINTKSFINLSSLIVLNLDDNGLSWIPVCEDAGIPVYPNLELLTMNKNTNPMFYKLIFEKCLCNLRKFSMTKSEIYMIMNNSLAEVKALSEMDLSGTTIQVIESDALLSNSLTQLILENAVVRSCIDSEVFERAPMLTFITLENIDIQCVSRNAKDEHQMQIEISEWIGFSFRNLTNLKILNLSGRGQKLISLREETFRHSTFIRYLYLRNIDIKFVKYDSLPSELWTNLIELDLSGNPFVCDCELVWFRRWLERVNATKTKVLHLEDPTAYTCAYPVEDFGKSILGRTGPLTVLNELRCFSNYKSEDWILFTEFMFLIIIGILSLLISLLYRYRWHVRYWHFVIKAKRQQEYDILDEQQYEYDAFVMYSQQDSAWVIHELRPYLETGEHLHLCLHHRDFLGGRDIVENIVDGIEGSRKCLLIVSNAFAESNWCQFEMTMAQTSSIRADRRKVILVLLEEIAEINMTPRLRLQMAEQTYIEWTSNIVSQQLFWKQLARAIKKPTSSVVHSQSF